MMRRPHLKKILVTLLLVGIAAPALASLIYTWEDLDSTGATGMIEFANGVDFYDEELDVLAFSFTTPLGQSFDETFAFEALAGVDLGAEFLCFGSCSGKKTGAKKKAKTDTVLLLFGPTERTFKKGTPELELRSFMDWSVSVGKKKAKKKADGSIDEVIEFPVEEIGFGRWARVSVPEPSALLLVFTGLGILSHFRRRVARR